MPLLKKRGGKTVIYTLKAAGSHVHAPTHYVLPQKHAECEIIYYHSALGETTVAHETYVFSSGSLVVIPPNMEHDELVKSPGRVIYCRFIGTDGVSPFMAPLFFETMPNRETVFAILSKIVDEKVCRRRGYTEYVDALLQQLVLEIERIACRIKYPDVVARIAHYIQSTYHENIDFERLSESYGYSLSHVRHVFKKEKRISLYQYLVDVRMGEAKRYLNSTTLPIQKIASLCGYKETNFVAMFSRKFGITPMQYRMLFCSENGDVVILKKEEPDFRVPACEEELPIEAAPDEVEE